MIYNARAWTASTPHRYSRPSKPKLLIIVELGYLPPLAERSGELITGYRRPGRLGADV